MNLSINAIRALVLAANMLLLALIGWAVYETFFYVDEERWKVEIPKDERYVPPTIAGDERQQQQQLYKVISRVFDPPAPKPEPVIAQQPERTSGPDVKQIRVATIYYNPTDPAASSAYLTPPGGGAGRYYMPGQELSQLQGFEMFRGVKVKEIRANGDVVLVDGQGKETVIEGPKQASQS